MEEIKNYVIAQAAKRNDEIVKALQQQHQEAQEKSLAQNKKIKEEIKKSLLKVSFPAIINMQSYELPNSYERDQLIEYNDNHKNKNPKLLLSHGNFITANFLK